MSPSATLLAFAGGVFALAGALGAALAWRSIWLPVALAALLSLAGIWTIIDARAQPVDWPTGLGQVLLVVMVLAPAAFGLIAGGALRRWRARHASRSDQTSGHNDA